MKGKLLHLSLLLVLMMGADATAQNRGFAFTRRPPPVLDESPLTQPRMFWNSGEYLDGVIVAADAQSVSIQSDLFSEPVQLQMGELERIDFPATTAQSENLPFSVLLKNGDRLFADVTGITAAGLTLKNERHGELTVPLASIQRLQRVKGGPLVYAGPTGALGWKHYGLRDAQGFPWHAGARGSMITRVWNRAAMMEMELPEQVELEIVLSSTGPLRFGISLSQASGSTQVSTVETWQDDLVIAQMNRFTPVMRLNDEDHSIGLRLFMDRKSNKMRLCDWSGKELAQFDNDPVVVAKPCVLVRNKGANLMIEHVAVRTWDGATVATRDVKQPSIESMDGKFQQGAIAAGADGKSLVVGAASVSLDQLLSFDAGPDAAEAGKLDPLKLPLAQMLRSTAKITAPTLSYADGTTLTGSIAGMNAGSFLVKSTLADNPIKADVKGMTRLMFPEGINAPAPLDGMDALHVGNVLLHGKLEGTGDSKLRWRLAGAMQPVAVARRQDVEIRRPAPKDRELQPSPALFFLKDGNVLGAKLERITAEAVEMKSPVAEVNKVEASQINAIHFNSRKVTSNGFSDPSWVVLKGTDKEVQHKGPDRVLLTGAGAFGHPGVLAGDEVSFTMTMPSYWGALAVDLFVGDFDNRTKGTQLNLIYSGSDFWSVLESGENNSRSSEQLRNLTTKTINVRLVFSEGNMSVYANDMALMSASIDSSQRRGSGIIFSPSTMWGNPTRDVEISNFAVKARPDFVQVPAVSEEARRNALTIPRFRRASIPSHVLLAPNGDVLRGKIESADAKSIHFQSALETIDVPVERVAAAVWLDKPKDPKAAADAKTPNLDGVATELASHWLLLHDGSRLAVKVDRFEKDRIRAWAPSLGDVTIPNDDLAMLKLSAPSPSAAMLAYQGWKPEFSAEPVLPETGGQSSPMLNKPAPDFSLPLLGGGQFNLNAEKGKVIVLDFWATWCGPCVMSMPEQLKAMAPFDPNKVKFIAVNQGEPEAAVAKFVQSRNWQMTVALDSQQVVGQKYGVEGIPHCVVISPDGKVVWTNTGYTPGESEKMAAAIRKLIDVQ